ncbi:vWA domain-containing protein [Halosolutus halophilus]|uniref:vWA domain-containing protein n=1 Tax=Halosolutus halophilus TaxID=1552990 RepID=UPI00223515F0|nr:VWA domain-containing protein [Halosolutus halophilus]
MIQRRRGYVITTLAVVAMLVLAGCSFGGGLEASSGGDAGDSLGYAVGGAQDVDNFRDNVEAGYLPIRSDVTHEGLFYDYYFETGDRDCDELFCPAYSRAVTADPLSNETEQYLSVGLNSNLEASEFERENLNLVVVLDVSGSMDSGMAEYHYDDESETVPEETKPKMDAANEATVALLDRLEDDDRFALVTFDDRAETVAPLERMDERDRDALETEIRSIEADGGTNLESGMDEARELVEPHADDAGYDTRIVYLTDAMPNAGDTSAGGLEARLEADAERGIHSTFVGVGMDFHSALVEEITAVRGANYYAVHSAERFEERMSEEFEYMVTPMVYDLELTLESEGYEIEEVYGSPDADEATGELLSVNTLFPSPTEDGASKGGVVLLQLNETGDDPDLELTASYEDRDGVRHETSERVVFDDREPEYFETDSVRKAVALSRYATLMENWIDHERASLAGDDPEAPDGGLERTDAPDLGEWERQSADLQVTPPYAERIDAFRDHFAAEADAIGDDSLERELETMATILEAAEEKSGDEAGGEERTDGNERDAVAPPAD